MDIERDTIAKIEGQSRWVSDAELVILARTLSVSLESLFPPLTKAEKLAQALLAPP